ncbi:TFIIB-type zinc ribbon-containing protein [Enterococcus sp. BWM-S5]|uniref:TFIIB-type zinc ribbon-containing protein n=1 Tax=Enterococcus larvae TaxID=2794352 RepID=A0ABS4CE64_9ENTE|nr:TFIIB-type zinc ribbon-containing protein [Enterococcus larvae]MBP1044762.1 TFIIB-type zinc ribbon-containing protein [Enterococcus larvae]
MDSTFTHKCPNCSGPLFFDAKDQKFHCEYCLSIFSEEQLTAFEQAQKEAHLQDSAPQTTATAEDTPQENTAAQTDAGDMELFTCSSCGAEIVTDATTAATYCYFCHNPVVLSGRISGKFLPNQVLPFAIEKEEAVQKFLAWTKKKRFIPRDFFNKQQIEKMTGVYFPYWLVDSEVSGDMHAEGTTLRVWRTGDTEYTETKQFAVRRKGKLSFKELIKNALSKNVQQKMVEGVQPFPMEKAVPFKSQYLAGFQAEKRDIEFEALKNDVEQEIKGYSQSMLEDSASAYTHLSKVQTSITIDDQELNYVLLPIWLVTYNNRSGDDKVYYYAMNGQTGKVSGELPISYKRLGITGGIIFAVLLVLFLIGGYMI